LIQDFPRLPPPPFRSPRAHQHMAHRGDDDDDDGDDDDDDGGDEDASRSGGGSQLPSPTIGMTVCERTHNCKRCIQVRRPLTPTPSHHKQSTPKHAEATAGKARPNPGTSRKRGSIGGPRQTTIREPHESRRWRHKPLTAANVEPTTPDWCTHHRKQRPPPSAQHGSRTRSQTPAITHYGPAE
jgi:hypothetical protein